MGYTTIAGLQVSTNIYELINEEIAPGTGVSTDQFWEALARIVRELAPVNLNLIEERNRLQEKIDRWVAGEKNQVLDARRQREFLRSIGYLVDEGGRFQVDVRNVDDEIALIAGPQLVVPVQIARYALNAANARWGSLYDAIYGTDVIGATDWNTTRNAAGG